MNRTLSAAVATTALLTGLMTGSLLGLVVTSPTAHATFGAVGLNEVESQPHAGGEDWVEIVNVSGEPLSIGGWKIRDLAGNSFTVPAATGLRAGGHYVFDVGSVLGGDDVVVLTDGTGTDIDWFHWFEHAEGTWSRCVEGTGSFLDRDSSKGSANPCRGPDITASVSSTKPISANGWYRAPVTVTYACKAGYAPISVCSLPQTLASTGADQSVIGSVFDTSGASDKIRVTGINIDRLGPKLVIKGVESKTYNIKQNPKLKAADPDSGLAKTRLRQIAKYYSWGVKYFVRAIGWDQAGNETRETLTYHVKPPKG
jgi:hypothetical protein